MTELHLTNEELLNRIRAQTDMIQQAQNTAQTALDLVNNLNTRETAIQSQVSATEYVANAALKSEDTTQKLLKELINEIKDLREDGKIQQEQIDQMRRELDEFKDTITEKVNQCYAEIQTTRLTKKIAFNPSPFIGNGGWTVEYHDENGHIGVYDESSSEESMKRFMVQEDDSENTDEDDDG